MSYLSAAGLHFHMDLIHCSLVVLLIPINMSTKQKNILLDDIILKYQKYVGQFGGGNMVCSSTNEFKSLLLMLLIVLCYVHLELFDLKRLYMTVSMATINFQPLNLWISHDRGANPARSSSCCCRLSDLGCSRCLFCRLMIHLSAPPSCLLSGPGAEERRGVWSSSLSRLSSTLLETVDSSVHCHMWGN